MGDEYYRLLLMARGIQVRSNRTVTRLKQMTDILFGQSEWENIGGGVVAFEACSTRFQLYQVARRAGLFEPADGVELRTIHGPWALTTGRDEIIRVFVTAGDVDTLYEAGSSGVLTPIDEIINESAGNGLRQIAWDTANETLTISALGTDNDLTNWIAGRAIEAFILDQDGNFEESVAITAPADEALAIEFPSSMAFPPVAGDQYLIVLAAVGSVEETGYALYQRPTVLRRRFRFRRSTDIDAFGMGRTGGQPGEWTKVENRARAMPITFELSVGDATGRVG